MIKNWIPAFAGMTTVLAIPSAVSLILEDFAVAELSTISLLSQPEIYTGVKRILQ